MPAKSARQQRFMGWQLNRKRKGLSTKVDMTEDQLRDFAATKHTGLRAKAKGK